MSDSETGKESTRLHVARPSAPEHRGHLIADVPALFIAAAVFSFLTPRRETRISSRPSTEVSA
jgi:hypothetical protein